MTYHQTRKKQKEDWISTRWRPAMAWMYMAVCIFDFLLFPMLWSMLQAHEHGQVTSQWQPLTLQGAGLFHIAMGAVLGITAYGRTREKIVGLDGGLDDGYGSVDFGPNAGTTYIPPNSNGYVNVTSNNTAPQNYGRHNSFNNNTSSVNNSTNIATPNGPPQNQFPEQ